MPIDDSREILRLFDEQVRQGISDDTVNHFERTPRAVRHSAISDLGWSEISWSHLDEDSADSEIKRQIEYFTAARQDFVWKVYDSDLPQDLSSRLLAAGFGVIATSQLMIARVADVHFSVELPPGVELVRANNPDGIDQLIDIHDRVFAREHSQLRRQLYGQMERSPSRSEIVLVTAGGVPVASSRAELLPDHDFVSLWGGGTLPEWRGKGLYRAMVTHRARVARSRGYSYLYVTASEQSRPILESLDFQPFGSVTAYEWRHQNPAG